MIKKLIKLANHLDSKGLIKEADYIDNILIKYSNDDNTKSDFDDSFDVVNKTSDFAKRLKDATLGKFVATKDPGFHLQTPILKALEFLGGLGTDESAVYAVFQEMKNLEEVNNEFKLENVGKKFKAMLGVKNVSLFKVLNSELEPDEKVKLEGIFPNAMDRLAKVN